jgi:hypothetical protein
MHLMETAMTTTTTPQQQGMTPREALRMQARALLERALVRLEAQMGALPQEENLELLLTLRATAPRPAPQARGKRHKQPRLRLVVNNRE